MQKKKGECSQRDLKKIPGVGANMEKHLNNIGIYCIDDLKGKDPEELYHLDCLKKGFCDDRCVLYVFRCAVYFAEQKEHDPKKLKWWYWKDKAYPETKQSQAEGEKSMQTRQYEYDARIQEVKGKGGAYVPFPYDVRKEFHAGRAKVHVEFDGEPYDGSVVNMGVKNSDGSICYIIGIRKDIREKIKKQPGDSVHVLVRERNEK